MNYIDQIAHAVYERVPAKNLPDDSTFGLFRIYAVLLLAKGDKVDARDVHNAWVAWNNSFNSQHESSVPFEQLSETVAAEDLPFVQAIHEVVDTMKQGL